MESGMELLHRSHGMQIIDKPRRNAVIVEEIGGRLVVTIECKDETELPNLKRNAEHIYLLINGSAKSSPL